MKDVLQIVKCFLGLGLQTGLCKQLDKSLIRSTWLVLCVRPLAVSRIMCWLKKGSGWYILAILFCASDLLNRSRFCVCVCKRWIHVGICQWSAQSPVLPICIPPVCQMGLGGLRSGKSSFFQEEQQVLSIKKEIEVASSAKLVEPGHVRGLVAGLCMTLLSWAPWSQVSKEQDWCHSCVPGSLLQGMVFQPAGQRGEPLVAWYRPYSWLNGASRQTWPM